MMRQRIQKGGVIRIPAQLLKILGLSEGDEVDLRAETAKLVITARKSPRIEVESQQKTKNGHFTVTHMGPIIGRLSRREIYGER